MPELRGSLLRPTSAFLVSGLARIFLILCVAFVCPGLWAETVYLHNGFVLEVDSHTREADIVTLALSTGTIQMHSADIDRIDAPPSVAVANAFVSQKSKTANSRLAADAAEALTVRDVIARAGVAQGLPPEFVLSVAKVESGLQPNAISPKGAIGLMQLMPATASSLGVRPSRPDENAQGGAIYLRSLLLKYHGDAALALAAYNAGPGAVSKYGGVPPYSETRRYIERVLNEYARQRVGKEKEKSTRPATPAPVSQVAATSDAQSLSRPSATN